MVIRYAEDGRILSCTADDWEIEDPDSEPGQVLRVGDEKLPDDFLRTFAAGKYVVRKGKVVKAPDYTPPDPLDLDVLLPSTPGSPPEEDEGTEPDEE